MYYMCDTYVIHVQCFWCIIHVIHKFIAYVILYSKTCVLKPPHAPIKSDVNHPPPPGGSTEPTLVNHTHLLSTVMSYDNTVNNNKLLIAHGSNVMTSLIHYQCNSWTSPLMRL